ncbi:MAG: hypothetical protein OQK09_14660 [Colwellia sp.]|nr:hypothetical protein [Colwellia sp.]MCW8863597.1 hypothetical protein [Colwellia sp.]MCW9082750.1 hypothetical protein [Colwellia sp.]
MHKDDKSIYKNKKSEQQIQLTKPIQELVELDQTKTFETTITCGLANWLSETKCLRELLDAVANYDFERDKDHPRLFVGGYFAFKDKKIFFKNRPGAILIGLLYEIELIPKFAEYQYFSIEAIQSF